MTAEDDDARADPLTHPVGEGLKVLEVGLANVLGDDLHGPELFRLREERRRDRIGAAPLQGEALLVETLTRLDELGHRLGQSRRRHAQRGCGPRGAVAHLAHLAQGADARHGLEPPHARADRLLFGDEEEPDVAGAVAMRSAAELARRAGLDDAHDVAVCLAEERHGPSRERLL